MIVNVSWESTYGYSEVVRQVHNELHVVPADGYGQSLLAARVAVRPEARLFEMVDAFGNRFHHFDVLESVERIAVSLEAQVQTGMAPEPAPELSPLVRLLLVQPTDRSPFDPAITALADEVAPPDAPPLVLAESLCTLIADRFVYEVGSTKVEDTAVDLLRLGRGVCQDFAHLMLAALRMRGFPSRYVSGYLAPDEGQVVAEASHAWAQVYADGAWHGFDPSNRTAQDERYVVTAVGRDYDDVPPLRGSYRGLAEQAWSASVRVQSQDDEGGQQQSQSQR